MRAWLLALVALAALPQAAQAGEASRKDWLAAHNAERALVGVPSLVWSTKAEKQAKAWAKELARTGRFEHSGVAGMGENLYATAGSGSPSAAAAVAEWASEKRFFDAQQRRCTRSWQECGHYTQLVWRDTTAVGCAIASTRKGRFEHVVVCNYLPPGNFRGEKPY